MKNYLVQTLVKVNSSDYGWKDRSDEGDLYSIYKKIQQVSYASYKKFLQGDWEYVLLETEVDNVLDVFRNNFEKINELRKQEPCNILFCGLDTQMVQPTDLFGKIHRFTMFNYTDPRSNSKFENNFNCDVRYYPAELDEKWWDYTIDQSKKLAVWEDEQNVYNHILWNQEPAPSVQEVLVPQMAYQGFMIGSLEDPNINYGNQWNGVELNRSHIIHWHSSRGAQNRLNLMSEVNRRTGVLENQ